MTPEAAVVHPSRAKIVEILAKASDGATAFEIADAMDLHHNAVRTHLSVLARAGLVWSEREKGTGRPGRPRIIFRLIDPDAAGEVGSRKALVDMLVRLGARARLLQVEIEAVGVEEGRALAARGRSLVDTLQRTGYAPDDVTDAEQAARGETHVTLRHCPFADAAAGEHGEMVCGLHLGIVKGLIAEQGGEVIAFEPVNPHAPSCILATRVPIEAASPDAVEPTGSGSGARSATPIRKAQAAPRVRAAKADGISGKNGKA